MFVTTFLMQSGVFLGQCGFLYGDSSQQTWWKLKWWSICNQVLVPFGSNPALFGDVGALSRSRLDFRESGTLGFGSWFTVKSPICCITRVPKFERKRMKERERERKKKERVKEEKVIFDCWNSFSMFQLWDLKMLTRCWDDGPSNQQLGVVSTDWPCNSGVDLRMDQDQYIPKLARSS